MIHLFRFVIICVFKDASEYTDYICEIPNGLKGSMFIFIERTDLTITGKKFNCQHKVKK